MLSVGQKVAGRKILWKGDVVTFRGGKQTAFRFRCDCKAEFQVNLPTVTKAAKGAVRLRCQDCQKKEKLKSNCAQGVEPVRPPAPSADKLPPELRVSEAVKRMLAKLDTEHHARTVDTFKRHVAACLRDRIPLDSIDRIWIEAAEVAAKLREGDEWTRENISDGLQRQRYRQYTSPSREAFV